MITLTSSDKVSFEVEETVVCQCETLKAMVEDCCTADGIPVPNVKGSVLAKVIEYCKKHAQSSGADADAEELKKRNEEFLRVGFNDLFDLILAANYLNVKSLLDVTCQAVADRIKDYSVEQVRQIFDIVNDFTPEEEEKVRQENAWAFDI